jgi:hypothetical protein
MAAHPAAGGKKLFRSNTMKQIFKFLCVLCVLCGAGFSQTITSVTGTVRDQNGVPYVNCTVLPQFVNVSGGATPTVTANGGPVIPPTSPTLCNSSGVFNVSVIANGSVTPASTHWQFLICSAPGTQYPDPGSLGSQCFTTSQITITGSSQDISTQINAVPPPALIYGNLNQSLGSYQGTTSVPITDTAFHALIAASSDILIPANFTSVAGHKIRIHGSGVYTTGAASVLNAEVMLCQVSGCATGTVVAPAGCAITSTNQANVLANGQFWIDCTITSTSTLGSSGTFMAKGQLCINLGATTAVGCTDFLDTATAVSAAVDQTVNEFVNIAFKFTTSNAGNSAILLEADAKVDH